MKKPEYSFHQKCYTCSHVIDDNRPILFGYRDGGDIILHCGEGHDWELDPPKVVGIGHLIERDTSIMEILSLADGFEMERKSRSERWEFRSTPSMDE